MKQDCVQSWSPHNTVDSFAWSVWPSINNTQHSLTLVVGLHVDPRFQSWCFWSFISKTFFSTRNLVQNQLWHKGANRHRGLRWVEPRLHLRNHIFVCFSSFPKCWKTYGVDSCLHPASRYPRLLDLCPWPRFWGSPKGWECAFVYGHRKTCCIWLNRTSLALKYRRKAHSVHNEHVMVNKRDNNLTYRWVPLY